MPRPDYRSYLRFNVNDISGSVTNATLRLYTTSSSSTAFRCSAWQPKLGGELHHVLERSCRRSCDWLLRQFFFGQLGQRRCDLPHYWQWGLRSGVHHHQPQYHELQQPGCEQQPAGAHRANDGWRCPHVRRLPPERHQLRETATPHPCRSRETPSCSQPSPMHGVAQSSPTTNYGTATNLQADGDSGIAQTSFIRFATSGITGPIRRARLRVFCTTNGTANGPAVYLANSSWTESGRWCDLEYPACTLERRRG